MKTSSILASLIALALLASCGNEGGSPTPESNAKSSKPKADIAAMDASGLKIAYINTDTVLSNYDLVKELEEEIIQEKISLENRYKGQVEQLEKEFAYAQQEAASLPPDKLQMLQAEFAQKEQQLMLSKQQLEQQLLSSEQNKNERLYKEIQDFLAAYSTNEGFDIIFGYNGFGNVLYAADRFDITQMVVDSLNTMYANENEELSEK